MNKRVQFSFFNLTKLAVLLAVLFAPELLAQGQSIVWAKSLKGRGTSTIENLEPGMSLAYDIAIDSQSHVIITGYSTDSVDFDPGTAELVLVSPAHNPYLAKYNQNGELLWSHLFPSTWNANGYSVAIDGSDNIIFTGQALRATDFDPGPAEWILGADNSDAGFAFIAKFDPEGNLLFALEVSGEYGAIPNVVRCRANGNILIAGRFYGNLDIDPSAGITMLDGNNGGGFWAEFDPSGAFIYGKALSGITNIGDITDLSLSANGDVLLAGYFGSSVDFDPGGAETILEAVSPADRFFARYSSGGDLLWVKQLNLNSYGCCSPSEYVGIRENSVGEIIIAGNFKEAADFDPDFGQSYLFGGQATSAYFAKYSSAGSFLFAKAIRGGFCPIYDLELDCNDEIYLAGSLGSADFDPSTGVYELVSNSASAFTHFMARYSTDGDLLDAAQIGSSSSGPLVVSMSLSEQFQYMAGGFRYTADFDPDAGETLLTMGGIGWNTYFAKYAIDPHFEQVDTTFCDLSVAVLDATLAGASYAWSTGSDFPSIEVTESGIYEVEINQDECTQYRRFQVDFRILPGLDLDSVALLCTSDSPLEVSLSPGSFDLQWNDGSSDSLRSFYDPGFYWVEISDSLCSRRDSFELAFRDCEVILTMPNVFTPNGDGINDVFLPLELKGIQSARLTVYNRWGQVVYDSDDLKIGWTGGSSNQPASEGVYFYTIDYSTVLGDRLRAAGEFTLLRGE